MRQLKPELNDATLIARQTSESPATFTVKPLRKRTRLSFWLTMCGVYALLIALAVYLSLPPAFDVEARSSEGKQIILTAPEQTDTLGKLSFARTVFVFTGANIYLFTANADGTGETGLTQYPPHVPTTSTWSPDGTKIAFTDAIAISNEIFVVNSGGGTPLNLTNTGSSIAETNPDWSVTNKIAYERDFQIWMMNPDGSNQLPFPGIVQPSPAAPAWSPDGSQLAFVSNGEIYVINANGTNERRVTINSTADANPDWSADGTKIVFSRASAGIAVINADGTNETPLTTGDDREPVWSQDGTKIAFVRKSTSVNGIYLMDANGANQIRVIADNQQPRGYESNSPAWQPVAAPPNTFVIGGRVTRNGASLEGVTVNLTGTVTATTTTHAQGSYQFSNLPAGGNYTVTPSLASHAFTPPTQTFNNLNANRIADFTAVENCVGANCGKIMFVRGGHIWLMERDGTLQTPITSSAGSNGEPSFSFDGRKIVFVSNRDGNNEIYTMNSDGSNQVRVTNNTFNDDQPAFSPDGGKIVFVTNRDGNDEIYSMNIDGSNQVNISNNPESDIMPSYAPDGSKIIFVRRYLFQNIHTMSPDGTNQRNLQSQFGFYASPTYSLDGSKIVFNYGPTQGIWIMNADGTSREQILQYVQMPSFSPDGTKVLYSCCLLAPQNSGIWVINASGGASTALTFGDDILPKWQPLQSTRSAFDFDGDRKADVSVFRPSNGYWFLFNSLTGFSSQQFGIATDKITPADYDGDGKTDVAVWRPAAGDESKFFILNSSSNTVRTEMFALIGDVPFAADWDGDGRADPTAYRSGAGGGQSYFFYRPSSQPGVNFITVSWGAGGDKPVVGDYDADGKADAAVFRSSNGGWYVSLSSNGQVYAVQFGANSDVPATGDFDGDGKTDVSVFRPSSGGWYRLNSANGQFAAVQFGATGDLPVAADYDGDGKADVSVFRPSNGGWYRINSTNGQFFAVQFGTSGDIPIPAAYIQ